MNRTGAASVLVLLGGAFCIGCGCAEHRIYVPMSHHTIGIAEHQDLDVLWIQDDHGSLYRCSNTS